MTKLVTTVYEGARVTAFCNDDLHSLRATITYALARPLRVHSPGKMVSMRIETLDYRRQTR